MKVAEKPVPMARQVYEVLHQSMVYLLVLPLLQEVLVPVFQLNPYYYQNLLLKLAPPYIV
jgi:hypothetical protein